MASDNFELLQEPYHPDDRKIFNHLQRVFTTHPIIYGFIFITIFTLDIAEICNDWLLLKDVIYLEQGLVYGPISPTIVMILIVVSGIGSLALAFELLNISRFICTGRPWGDLDLVSAIVVWAEELTTMSVNFAIAMCHNEPISMFQMSKIIIVAVSVVIRIIVPLMKTYLIKVDSIEDEDSFRKSVYRVVTNAGLCLALCSTVAVAIFTHVIATDERKFQFRLPSEIWSSKFAHNTYFTDVGIYFHHNKLNEAVKDQYWLKLTGLNDFEKIHKMYVKIGYTRSNNKIQRLILNSYSDVEELYDECYKYDSTVNQYAFTNCTVDFIPSNGERLIFKFLFEDPRQYLILGDILYSVQYQKANICYTPTINNTNIFHNNTGQELDLLGRLVYLKPINQVNENHHLIDRTYTIEEDTTNMPYSVERDILEGEDIWTTGMYGCDCTGKAGPSYQSDLLISC